MKPKKKVENTIRRKLRFTAAATLRDRWWTDVLNAQEEANGITPALHEPFLARLRGFGGGFDFLGGRSPGFQGREGRWAAPKPL